MLRQITPSLCKQSQQHGYIMTSTIPLNKLIITRVEIHLLIDLHDAQYW